MPKPTLKIDLVDAINRDVDIAIGFISKSGGHVYVVYQHNVSTAGNLATELFLNADGTLVSVEQFFTSAQTPGVYGGGGASRDFTRFAVFTQQDVEGGIGRVTVLDRDFSVVASRDLTDYFAPSTSLLGVSPFSQDGKYLAFSYNTTNAPPSLSVLRIVDAETLEDVGQLQFNGYTNGPYLFSVPDDCDRTHYYVLLPIVGQDTLGSFVAPASINIYEFFPRTGNFALVDKQALPQIAISYDVVYSPALKKAVITIGTREAVGPNDVAPAITPRASFLRKDTAEVRVYTFDGNNLALVATENPNSAVSEVKIHPSGQYIVYGLRPPSFGGQAPPTVLLPAFRINYDKCKLECAGDKGHVIAPTSIGGDFSSNGKWLLTTGSGKGAINAIQLFAVSLDC